MSKLLAGLVTFVLCTLSVEEQEQQPLSSVRPAEQARLMHRERFYTEQHTTWEAKSPRAKLPGLPLFQRQSQRSYFYSALHCPTRAVTGSGVEMGDLWHPTPKG